MAESCMRAEWWILHLGYQDMTPMAVQPRVSSPDHVNLLSSNTMCIVQLQKAEFGTSLMLLTCDHEWHRLSELQRKYSRYKLCNYGVCLMFLLWRHFTGSLPKHRYDPRYLIDLNYLWWLTDRSSRKLWNKGRPRLPVPSRAFGVSGKNALVLPFTHTQALVQSPVGHPTMPGRVKDQIKMCRKNWWQENNYLIWVYGLCT